MKAVDLTHFVNWINNNTTYYIHPSQIPLYLEQTIEKRKKALGVS